MQDCCNSFCVPDKLAAKCIVRDSQMMSSGSSWFISPLRTSHVHEHFCKCVTQPANFEFVQKPTARVRWRTNLFTRQTESIVSGARHVAATNLKTRYLGLCCFNFGHFLICLFWVPQLYGIDIPGPPLKGSQEKIETLLPLSFQILLRNTGYFNLFMSLKLLQTPHNSCPHEGHNLWVSHVI